MLFAAHSTGAMTYATTAGLLDDHDMTNDVSILC
jgi:hypothetical protein